MPNPTRLGNRKGRGRATEISISSCRAGEIPLSSGVPKLKKILFYWLPPAAWMILIFSASGDTQSYRHSSSLFVPLLHWLFPWMSSELIDTIHHLFRKCGHLTEFAVLALLLWRAIRQPQAGDQRPWRWDEAGLKRCDDAGLFLTFPKTLRSTLCQFAPKITHQFAPENHPPLR